ncbi:RNA polymerase sigma factor [[Pseudomonas] carboxydohydrogena]|uniref:RNA polymerase sigma factor n=1 Tax=Afipia carboxydohydrogena TaxID=290 RepID=A0ABY8BTX9_AFICR|nr:RNA polymerase sigma factor [[Pseudomonas] carboxydohydrogena]WEF51867.1 RNA polymerase sigma factor [[Pseudomonas] carboxydohydrogena]
MTDSHNQARLPALDETTSDEVLVHAARGGDARAFRAILTKYNRRLYRIARGILRNDTEAEDAVQEAYVSAFTHLAAFRGESSLSTWLSRIVMNESLGRLRNRRPMAELAEVETPGQAAEIIQFPNTARTDPERTMAQRELLRLVERVTDELPDVYRTVFVTRVIEGMSVEDTAELLGIRIETVKTRLHRARKLVREHLDREIGPVMLDAFPFAGKRCERMTQNVMQRLGLV